MTTESIVSLTDDLATQTASTDESTRDHHGSLRSKLVLSLAAMFLVFLTVDEVVRQKVIKPEFAALERTSAIRDANRVVAAMQANVEHLSDLAKHWAGRFNYQSLTVGVADSQGDRQNTWTPQNLEWAAVVSEDGTWRWLHKGEHCSGESGDFDYRKFNAIAMRCGRSDDPTVSGMTRLDDNSLVMFAAAVITPAVGQQNTQPGGRQYLVVGRTIDQAMIATLQKQTQVDFSLQSMYTQDPAQTLQVWEADESILVVEFHLPGIDNEQLVNVFVQVPREITAHSSHTTSMARNSFIFGSVAALLLLLLLLQRIVIGPLTAIREHSDRVAENGFDTEPLVLRGNDEIGELASAFDHMMHHLSDAQNQLAEASRAAGRSQVASTVIHNVGNVLTNVNSLLDVAAERVDGLRIQPLSKLAERLRQTASDSALMEATPDYLEGLAASLNTDRETISQLMSTLHDNIRHIHDVIRDQQRYTRHSVKPAAVALRDVIDEAIGCCRAQLEQDSVQVNVSGSLDVKVRSDRSLLLQSVINVIGNARHALRENEGESRELSIHAELQRDSVIVEFIDNGIGMSGETLQKVFDAHFTTRKTGCGLGLHFCANTLKRMGGSIRAQSDGPGHGSTFVIELPLASTRSTFPIVDVSLDAIGAGS